MHMLPKYPKLTLIKVVAAVGFCIIMDKFEAFKPDKETIESWLDALEARLICNC